MRSALRRRQSVRSGFRPQVEALERRDLPATISLVPFNAASPVLSLAPGVVGQSYSQDITVPNGTGNYTFGFPTAGVNGLTFAQNGATLTLSGKPLAASSSTNPFTFTVSVTDTAGNSGSQQYTLNVSAQPLSVNLTQLPPATVGVNYSTTITASGGTAPYQFVWPGVTSSNTGKFGLVFTPPNGSANLVLSGTPMTPGTFPLNVQVADMSATGTNGFNNVIVERYLLTVNSAARGPLALTLASSTALGLPVATVGTAYSQTLTASGGSGTYNFTVPQGSLGGLSFGVAGANVTLSGTPTSTGSFSFKITVTDANAPSNTLTQPYTLVINPAGITIVPSLLPPATQNMPYVPQEPDPATSFTQGSNASTTRPVQLSASGGSGTGYVFSANGVPPGMTFSSGGVLGGTPAVSGTFTIQVTATDSQGNKGTISYPFTVLPWATSSGSTPPTPALGSQPAFYSPAQIQQAYGFNDIILGGGIIGNGAGQTIVIIEDADNPNFVSSVPAMNPQAATFPYSMSDLAKFNAQFTLQDFGNQAGAPVFLKLDMNGSTNYPTNTPGVVELSEFAQDVEWAHALAPMANIVVLERGSATGTENVLQAVQFVMNGQLLNVAKQKGVTIPYPTVISYSGKAFFDQAGEATNDSIFQTQTTNGITTIFSAGDEAAFGGGFSQQTTLYGGVEYPAASPYVLGAGETMLVTDLAGNYLGEAAFVNSGAGISMFESQPTFQQGVVSAYSTTNRTTPDVAIIGASASPVSVYNSGLPNPPYPPPNPVPNPPWIRGFGTSLSAPIWAALIAITNQGRLAAGQGTLSTQGPSSNFPQVLPMLYQLPATDFNPITQLSDGTAIPPGYNLHTGLGSPVANRLVAGLVGGHDTISGTVSNASSGAGLPGLQVFLDANNDGVYAPGVEGATTTDGNGNYSFLVAPGSNYLVRVQPPPGGVQVSANPAAINFPAGQDRSQTGVNFQFVQRLLLAVGAGAGGGPEVKVFNALTQTLLFDFFAYNPLFTGGVRVAVGDVTGDGIDDIVTAPGPGGGPDVKVFDGTTGQFVAQFFAFDPNFTGGVYVATGQVIPGGAAEIICAPDTGGGATVSVFLLNLAAGPAVQPVASFFPFDHAFTGGVRVAAGDVDGNGTDEIIAGAGPGGGPQVALFNGANGQILATFFAFNPLFTGGITVGATDVNGDGIYEIIAGADSGGGPSVGVFKATGALIDSFFAFASAFTGGVRVAGGFLNNSGSGQVLAGAGPGGGPQVAVFNGGTGQFIDSFFAFNPNFTGGLYVAATPS